MQIEPAQIHGAMQPLFEFAALSGAFDPVDALSLVGSGQAAALGILASRLAQSCDTHPGEGGDAWVMRTPERRKVLRRLQSGGRLVEAVVRRKALKPGHGTEELLQAIQGLGAYEDSFVEALALKPNPPRRQVEEMIVTLDRAGDVAPAYESLPLLRSALARLQQQDRLKELQQRGLVLREEHQELVSDWLKRRFTSSPVQVLYVAGPPGIGKSVLLETSVAAASTETTPILIRLDFDRAGLDVLDELGLTAEAARQVANETGSLGRALLAQRLRAASLAGGSSETLAAQRSMFPRELANAIGRAVKQSGREVLLVLDTLEALRGRGETHPSALFRWIDRLVDAGLSPVRLLAAGRDDSLPALASEPQRVGSQLDVSSLDDLTAEQLMDKLSVPGRLRPQVKELAQGNPLLLRVAVDLATDQADLANGAEKEVGAAFLYRALLSRIDDASLRDLLSPGLILASINPDALREVVAPTLDLPALTSMEADRLFRALRDQTWLVEADPYAPGSVRMKPAMRSLILPLLYQIRRGDCARLDLRAARWFARKPDPWSQGLATYHRLQRMRVGPAPVGISPQMALAIDEKMIDNLPPRAQDLVRALRGDRTSQLRVGSGTSAAADDEVIVRELLGIIERQDWNEGRYAADQLTRNGAIDPTSRAADALRAYWWRSGRWAKARAWMLEREKLSDLAGDLELNRLPSPLALVRLEMEAEFEPDRLALRMARHPPLVESAVELARSSPDDIARAGAVAFVVGNVTRGGLLGPAFGVDVAGAALSYFGDVLPPAGQDDLRRALSAGNEGMMARRAHRFEPNPPASHDWNAVEVARLLATRTPYAAMAVNLSRQPELEWLTDWAAAADSKLGRVGALLPWEADLQVQGSDHPILELARLGLFAEWVQAAAFLRRDPDLRLVGRSAEAWRRTVAGDWRFGRRPRGWRARVTDVTLEQRLDRLLKANEPGTEAINSLGLWTAAAEPDGDEVWAGIQQRVSRPRTTGVEALRTLLGKRVPSSFAPAMAALCSVRGNAALEEEG